MLRKYRVGQKTGLFLNVDNFATACGNFMDCEYLRKLGKEYLTH